MAQIPEDGLPGIPWRNAGFVLEPRDSVSDAVGDLYYRLNATGTFPGLGKLSIGTAKQILKVVSGKPAWSNDDRGIGLPEIVDSDTAVSVADGKKAFVVPSNLDGADLIDAIASVHDKGITGTTNIQIRRVRVESEIGDSTTQFDITDQGGNTFRYTYDTTGTDPGIEDDPDSLEVGDQIDIQAQNFNANNNGLFAITGVGDNYFEVTNASGVAEANKTIGTGSITPIKHRNMLSTAITIGDEFFASDGVVDTDFDDLEEGDKIYADVDAIHSGTAPNGLAVSVTVRL